MISKELLSDVLGEDVSGVSIIGNVVNYTIEDYETEEDGELVYVDIGQNINTYELAHKCKEWAYKQGLIIENFFAFGDARCRVYNTKWEEIYKCVMDTESEAIFKACQWILDNKADK